MTQFSMFWRNDIDVVDDDDDDDDDDNNKDDVTMMVGFGYHTIVS